MVARFTIVLNPRCGLEGNRNEKLFDELMIYIKLRFNKYAKMFLPIRGKVLFINLWLVIRIM